MAEAVSCYDRPRHSDHSRLCPASIVSTVNNHPPIIWTQSQWGATKPFCLSLSLLVPSQAWKCLLKLQNESIHFILCMYYILRRLSMLVFSLHIEYFIPCCLCAVLPLSVFSMQLLCVIEYLLCIPEAVLWDCCSFNYSLILKDQRSQPSTPPFHYNCAHTHTQAHAHTIMYAS